jgi:hypothetical protein
LNSQKKKYLSQLYQRIHKEKKATTSLYAPKIHLLQQKLELG